MQTSLLVVILCVVCACIIDSLASASPVPPAPATVRLGGIFCPLSNSMNVYHDQSEHLAAFLMAINDINNKSDGIYDYLLPNTTIEFAVGFESSVATAATTAVRVAESFGGQGVNTVVAPLANKDSLLVAQLLNSMDTMYVQTWSYTAGFDLHSTYPYVANIRPLVSRQGMVLQNMICNSNARKIVVFAGTDNDDIQMISQFQDESICELDIMGIINVRADLVDMSNEIKQAIPLGGRYFVTLIPAHQQAYLLEQGYPAGLFNENTVIYTSGLGQLNITSYFSPETDLEQMLTGMFYFRYNPVYYLHTVPEAATFSRRWREQPSRAGHISNGQQHCDQTKDDDGNFLYQVTVNSTTYCTGLSFSHYTSTGSNILPFTFLTYDGTMMALMALDMAIRNGLDYEDPSVLLDLMVANISFTGATGPLNLFKGYEAYGNDGRGTRNAGTPYNVFNFNPDLYRNGSNNYMVRVGIFDGDTRVYNPCAPIDHVTCFPATYRSQTDGSYHNPPADSPPVIISSITPAFAALCFTMAGITLFLVLVFGLFTCIHRRSRVIKSSQPTLLWCILIGGVVAALRIGMGAIAKNDSVCSEELWFGHLAFTIMIGSLFVKSYRVHCIVNTKKLVRVTFSAMHAFRLLLGIVALMVVYLAITQSLGRPHMKSQSSTVMNQQTDVYYCAMEYSQFQTTLFVMEGLMLIGSFRICWEIRNVPDIVNESKQISTAMSAIVLVSVLILPIVYFLGLNHFTQELVASFGFGFGAMVTLVLLFMPKIMVHYQLDGSKMSAKVAAEILISGKGKYVHDNLGVNVGALDMMRVDVDAEAKLKGKTKEEKLFVCQEQLRYWQVLLMVQQRVALNSHSTSSNAQGSSEGMSPSPIRIEQSLMSSVIPDPADFNGGALHGELFAIGENNFNQNSCVAGTYNSGSAAGELVIQDV
jgi:hypothetical protein